MNVELSLAACDTPLNLQEPVMQIINQINNMMWYSLNGAELWSFKYLSWTSILKYGKILILFTKKSYQQNQHLKFYYWRDFRKNFLPCIFVQKIHMNVCVWTNLSIFEKKNQQCIYKTDWKKQFECVYV